MPDSTAVVSKVLEWSILCGVLLVLLFLSGWAHWKLYQAREEKDRRHAEELAAINAQRIVDASTNATNRQTQAEQQRVVLEKLSTVLGKMEANGNTTAADRKLLLAIAAKLKIDLSPFAQ